MPKLGTLQLRRGDSSTYSTHGFTPLFVHPPALMPQVHVYPVHAAGLLYALCNHAMESGIRCGFCVPRPQLLKRWMQAGVKMEQVGGREGGEY